MRENNLRIFLLRFVQLYRLSTFALTNRIVIMPRKKLMKVKGSKNSCKRMEYPTM